MCLAVPGRVVSIEQGGSDLLSGKVEFGGVTREVCLACTPEAKVGDFVLVHAGLSLSIVDEAEARTTFEYLAALGGLEE